MLNGVPQYVGKLGREMTVEQGAAAAELCTLNILARLRAACGGTLNKVSSCVKLVGYVNAKDDFTMHPRVVDGASALLARIFEEHGQHARSAIGVASLPHGVCVEVEAIFSLR